MQSCGNCAEYAPDDCTAKKPDFACQGYQCIMLENAVSAFVDTAPWCLPRNNYWCNLTDNPDCNGKCLSPTGGLI